jgi:hypothetical protein
MIERNGLLCEISNIWSLLTVITAFLTGVLNLVAACLLFRWLKRKRAGAMSCSNTQPLPRP